MEEFEADGHNPLKKDRVVMQEKETSQFNWLTSLAVFLPAWIQAQMNLGGKFSIALLHFYTDREWKH